MKELYRKVAASFAAWRETQDFWHGITQLWIAIDQLLNVLSNPFSKQTWADETVSSRCGRLGHRYPYKFWKWLIDTFLFSWWQGPNHCVNAQAKEMTRYHFPPSMRGNASDPAKETTKT